MFPSVEPVFGSGKIECELTVGTPGPSHRSDTYLEYAFIRQTRTQRDHGDVGGAENIALHTVRGKQRYVLAATRRTKAASRRQQHRCNREEVAAGDRGKCAPAERKPPRSDTVCPVRLQAFLVPNTALARALACGMFVLQRTRSSSCEDGAVLPSTRPPALCHSPLPYLLAALVIASAAVSFHSPRPRRAPDRAGAERRRPLPWLMPPRRVASSHTQPTALDNCRPGRVLHTGLAAEVSTNPFV